MTSENLRQLVQAISSEKNYYRILPNVVRTGVWELCGLARDLAEKRQRLERLLFSYYTAAQEEHERMQDGGDYRKKPEKKIAVLFLSLVFRNLPFQNDWTEVRRCLLACLPRTMLGEIAAGVFKQRIEPFACRDSQGMFDLLFAEWGSDWLCPRIPGSKFCDVRVLPRLVGYCTPKFVVEQLEKQVRAENSLWNLDSWAETIDQNFKNSYGIFLLDVARQLVKRIPEKVHHSKKLARLFRAEEKVIAAAVMELPIKAARKDMGNIIRSFLF